MARAVWKFLVDPGPDVQRIEVNDAQSVRPLALAEDGVGNLCLWAEVERDPGRVAALRYAVLGTGWDIPQDLPLEHVDTCVTEWGYVWHLYRIPTTARRNDEDL